MITGTFNKIPRRTNSHVHGWARTWSENLGVDLNYDNDVVDTLYLDHGANHVGESLNLFGGFNDTLKQSIDNLMQATVIYSLDKDCPDYGKSLKNRKDVKERGLEEWCDKLSEKLANARTLLSTDLDFDHLSVGDSHTAAYAPHNSCVIKRDGTTLNGQIGRDFDYIKETLSKRDFKSLTMSLGNIDVRFHICRLDADWKSMYDEWFRFGDSLGIDVEYSVPWPIEFEGRKLPKSGYYRNKAFYGSREQRGDLVNEIHNYMNSNSVNIVKCPEDWYQMNPEVYAKEHMENLSSVHLSPQCYRRMNWGKPKNNLESFFG